MATKTQQIKVGIFFTLGISLLIGIFVLIRTGQRKPTDPYFIKFKESVSGLSKDSPVLYLGVPVGKVEDLYVNAANEIITRIGIETNKVTLRKGTVAMLDLGNLMGGMLIDLSGGEANAPRLTAGSYIPTKPSVLQNITTELPQILSDIRSILDKFNRSMGEVSEARFGDLTKKADQVMSAAAQTLEQADSLIETTRGVIVNSESEVAQTLQEIREALREAQQTLRRLNSDPSSVIWGSHSPPHPYVK